MTLDESISVGQAGHIDDHETLHEFTNRLNGVKGANELVMSGGVTSDTFNRFELFADGRLRLGRGDVDPDGDVDAWVYINLNRAADQNGVYIKAPNALMQPLMVADYLGAPITWVNTDGAGLSTTDDITFQSTVFDRLISLAFTGTLVNPTGRSNPAIVFGQTAVGGGDTRGIKHRIYLEDASFDWFRVTGDWRASGDVVADTDGSIVELGAFGPSAEGGLRVGLEAKTVIYRSAADTLRSNGNFQVAEALNSHLFARLTSDVTKTSDTSLADTALSVSVAANATYVLNGFMIYDGDTTGDAKFMVTAPASSTYNWNLLGITGAAGASATDAGNFNLKVGASAVAIGGIGAGSKLGAQLRGIVRTAGTAGNVVMQFAQSASSGTASHLFTDSYIRLERVA